MKKKAYKPLGDVYSVQADIHIVAVTNRDLDRLVKADKFIKDLQHPTKPVSLKHVGRIKWHENSGKDIEMD